MAKREIDFGISTDQLDSAFDKAIKKLQQMKDSTDELDKGKTDKVRSEIKSVADETNSAANEIDKAVGKISKSFKKLNDIDFKINSKKGKNDFSTVFVNNKSLSKAKDQLNKQKESILSAVRDYYNSIDVIKNSYNDYDAKSHRPSSLTKGLFDESSVEQSYQNFFKNTKKKEQEYTKAQQEMIRTREELYHSFVNIQNKFKSAKLGDFSDLSANKEVLTAGAQLVQIAKMISNYNDKIGISDKKYSAINATELQSQVNKLSESMLKKGISAVYDNELQELESICNQFIGIAERISRGEVDAFKEMEVFISGLASESKTAVKEIAKVNEEFKKAERYIDESKKTASSLSQGKKTGDKYSTYATFNKPPKSVTDGAATEKEFQYVGEVANLLKNAGDKFEGHPGVEYFNKLIEKKPELADLAKIIAAFSKSVESIPNKDNVKNPVVVDKNDLENLKEAADAQKEFNDASEKGQKIKKDTSSSSNLDSVEADVSSFITTVSRLENYQNADPQWLADYTDKIRKGEIELSTALDEYKNKLAEKMQEIANEQEKARIKGEQVKLFIETFGESSNFGDKNVSKYVEILNQISSGALSAADGIEQFNKVVNEAPKQNGGLPGVENKSLKLTEEQVLDVCVALDKYQSKFSNMNYVLEKHGNDGYTKEWSENQKQELKEMQDALISKYPMVQKLFENLDFSKSIKVIEVSKLLDFSGFEEKIVTVEQLKSRLESLRDLYEKIEFNKYEEKHLYDQYEYDGDNAYYALRDYDVGNLESDDPDEIFKKTKELYSIYTKVKSAVKNHAGYFGDRQYNQNDVSNMEQGIKSLLALYVEAGGQVENLTKSMTKPFKEEGVKITSLYNEFQENNKLYEEEKTRLEESNKLLATRYNLLRQLFSYQTDEKNKDFHDRVELNDKIPYIGDLATYDIKEEFVITEKMLQKICNILGIDIPQAAEKTKQTIKESSSVMENSQNDVQVKTEEVKGKLEELTQKEVESAKQASTAADTFVEGESKKEKAAEEAAKVVENASDRIINAQEKASSQTNIPKSLQFNIADLDEKGLMQKIKSAENAINSGSSTADLWKEKLPLMQEALNNLVKQREEQERIAEETRKANLETEKKVALEKDYGENAIRQKGLIGDESGWSITNRTGAAQTQEVVYKFDEETGDLITTEMPLVTNFEQLKNLITNTDAKLASMRATLENNKRALGDAYDTTHIQKAIKSTEAYLVKLEKEAKLYGVNEEYAANYQKFLEDRKASKDLVDDLADDKKAQSKAREENKYAEALNRSNDFLSKRRIELKGIKQDYDAALNAKKPILNNPEVTKEDQEALKTLYSRIDKKIKEYEERKTALSSKEKTSLQEDIANLKLKKLELQNKYYGATTLSATELSDNKATVASNYDYLISKAKEAGTYTSDLVKRLEEQRSKIDSIGNSNGVKEATDHLKAYRAEFAKLQQEEHARISNQKAYKEQYKIIENYSDAQDKLNTLLGQEVKQGKSNELTEKIKNQKQEVEKLKAEAIEASKVLSSMNKSGLITTDRKRAAHSLLKNVGSGKTNSYSVLNEVLNDKSGKHKSEIDEITFKYEKLGLTSDEIKQKLKDLHKAHEEVNKSSSGSIEERIQKELNYQEVLKNTNEELAKFTRQEKINTSNQKANNNAYKEQYKIIENYSKKQDKLNALLIQQEKKGKSNELTAKIKEQTKEVEKLKLSAEAAKESIKKMFTAGSISTAKREKAVDLFNNTRDGKTASFSVLEGVKKDPKKVKNNYSDGLPWMKSEVIKHLKDFNSELGTFEKLTNVKTNGTATITFVNELADSTQRTTVQVKDLLQVLIDLQSGNFDPKNLGEYKITEVNRKDVEKAYKTMADTEENYRKLSIKRTAGTATQDQLDELKEIQDARNKAASVIKAKTAATEKEIEAQQKYNNVQEQTNKKLSAFVNNEQNVKSLMDSSEKIMSGFAKNTSKQNINGFDEIFNYYQDKVNELNKNLMNSNPTTATFDKYKNDIANIAMELDNILVGNVDIENAENAMRRYLNSIGVSANEIGKFDDINKTITATFTDQDKKIHNVTLGYDKLTRSIKIVKSTTENSKSFLTQFVDGLKGRVMALGQYLLSFASFYRIIGIIRQGITVVRELDTALTEMRKVSDETTQSLKNFQSVSFDIAKSVGTTAKQIQESTADFMRFGESLEQAAESAKVANTLLNVSEFESIDAATDSLVAMSAAYDELEKIEIVDKLNLIGNNFAISTDGLANALQKSASALTTAGNDIDEAIALATAANQVVQDPDSVGSGIRTISLRITGTETAKKELQELGEDVDDFVVTTSSKLNEQVKSLTKTVGKDGISLLDDNGNYRSTYEILQDIADVWEKIAEEDLKTGQNRQNALLELLAGKNRSNILASILESPDTLRKAYESSAYDSEGSAEKELNAYLDSIEGKIQLFTNEVQEFWYKLISSETVKNVVDAGTKIMDILGKLVDKIGLVGTAITAITAMSEVKRLFGKGNNSGGRAKQVCPQSNQICHRIV